VVEEGFKKTPDANDPRLLNFIRGCEKRMGAVFKKRAERVLLKIRFPGAPRGRPRLIQQVFGGRSAYLRVIFGRPLRGGRMLPLPEKLGWSCSAPPCRCGILTWRKNAFPHLKESKPDKNKLSDRTVLFSEARFTLQPLVFFRKVKDGDEDHPYQEGRCWVMLKDHDKAREAFSRVGGSLLPMGASAWRGLDLIEGDVESALKTARTIPGGAHQTGRALACAVVLASRGDTGRALKIIKDLKPDAENRLLEEPLGGPPWEPTFSPRGAPFQLFPYQHAENPGGVHAGGHARRRRSAHISGISSVQRPLWRCAILPRAPASEPRQEALILDGAREYRREVSVIYPHASRMLAAPPDTWDLSVLSRFFPRAFEGSVLKACAEAAWPPEVVWAVMRQESAFHPEALSPRAPWADAAHPPHVAANSLPDENPWDTESNIALGGALSEKAVCPAR